MQRQPNSTKSARKCHIDLGSKMWALVYTKRYFRFVGFFGTDTPINILEFGPTYCPKIVEGNTKSVIQALREFKNDFRWF